MIYFLWFALYILIGTEILICLDRYEPPEYKSLIFELIIFIIAWLPLLIVFIALEAKRHVQKRS